MDIIDHGIDLLNVPEFVQMARMADSDIVQRCFTEVERKEANNRNQPLEFLAGRFALKEAIVKALGSGFDGNVSPLEIEIITMPSGAPKAELSGAAKETARARGISNWLLSKSSASGMVMASAVALG